MPASDDGYLRGSAQCLCRSVTGIFLVLHRFQGRPLGDGCCRRHLACIVACLGILLTYRDPVLLLIESAPASLRSCSSNSLHTGAPTRSGTASVVALHSGGNSNSRDTDVARVSGTILRSSKRRNPWVHRIRLAPEPRPSRAATRLDESRVPASGGVFRPRTTFRKKWIERVARRAESG
jgi:hypothetical protein